MDKRTAGLIIATGYDSKSETIKPLYQMGDTSILRRQVVNMQLAGLSPIVVLSGWDSLRIEHHLDYYGVVFFQMEDFTHIQLRQDVLPVLGYLKDKCNQIIYAPVEYPLIQTSTIKKLMSAKGDICYPTYNGKRGFPTLIGEGILEKLDLTDLEKYDIFENYLDGQNLVATPVIVADEGILCNIENEAGCNRILKKHNKQMQHPYVHLNIDFDTKVFDVRLRLLLSMIYETKSVKKACTRVSMSVGKAWEYINLLEEKLQYPIVERRQGGRKGGGTDLTEEGKEYLEKYLELERKVQEYAQLEFRKIFEKDIS